MTQKGSLPIIVLLLLAIISSGGYLFYTKTHPPAIQPSSNTVDETASWETYSDPTGKFSIKIPPNTESANNGVGEFYICRYCNNQSEDEFQKAFGLVIKVDKNFSGTTLEQEKQILEKEKSDIQHDLYYDALDIKPYRNGQIEGLIYSEEYNNGDQTSSSKKILTIKNGDVYNFKYSIGEASVQPQGEKMVQKILSTFQFK